MRRSREQTLSTAFHEAGHAVIGYRVGKRMGWLGLHYVHVVPGFGAEGACKFVRLPPKTQAGWRAVLYMVTAGPMAQFYYDGYQDGGENDYEQIDECLQHVPKSHKSFESRVLRMVRADWPAIKAVAKALARRRFLNGFDFERIMQRVDKREAVRPARARRLP